MGFMIYFIRSFKHIVLIGWLLACFAASYASAQSPIMPETISLVEEAGAKNVHADIGFHADVGLSAVYAIDLDTPMSLKQARQRSDWQRVNARIIDGAKLVPDGTRPLIDFAEKKYPVWVYARLKNDTGKPGVWRLDTRRREFEKISIFAVRAEGAPETLLTHTWSTPFSKRVVPNRFLATELSIDAEETVDIYVNYVGNYNHTIHLKVASVNAYQSAYAIDGIWLAAFYSTTATIIVLAMLSMFFVGWRISLTFVLYLLCGTAAFASESGHLFQYIFPNHQVVSISLFNTAFSLMYFSSLMLAKTMFNLRKFSPAYNRFLTGVMIVIFIYAFIFPVFSIFPDQNEILDIIFDFVMLGSVFLHVVNGYAAIKTRQSGGVAFLLGGIVLVVLTFAVRPGLFGYIDGTDRTLPFGIIGVSESILFAVAMLQRAVGIRNERDEAVREQLKVSEEKLTLSNTLRDRERAFEDVRQKADRRKERLASVSHDILQPLTSLRASLGGLNFAEEEKMQNMHDAFDYLETLARDSMRGGSGEDGNNKTSRLETFPLKSVTDNAAAMFKDEAVAKGLKFKYSSIDTKVTSEPLQLMRALSNLLSNAIKHTHQGHVTIACATDTNHAKITISNSGAAMSDTDIQRYLMPYEKGEQSKGTGLGLYQVKQICGALGHKFELLSTENAGTQAIIKISLPS